MGAGIGASATVIGNLVNTRSQASHERTSWNRERKEAAYNNAIRYVLRARNRSSGLTEEGMSHMTEESIAAFFDDLVDAQHWVSMLTTACADDQRNALVAVRERLNRIVDESTGAPAEMPSRGSAIESGDAPSERFTKIYEQLLTSARADLGTRT